MFFLSNSARINLGFSLSDCIVHFFLISYQSTVTELRVLPQCESNCVGVFHCPSSGAGLCVCVFTLKWVSLYPSITAILCFLNFLAMLLFWESSK